MTWILPIAYSAWQPKFLLVVIVICLTASCKVEVYIPEGGQVKTQSGAYHCAPNKPCNIDVSDLFFDEIFVAVPHDGYRFVEWRKQAGGLFGGRTSPNVRVKTSSFEGNDLLMAFLNGDQIFFLEPVFERSAPASTEIAVSSLSFEPTIAGVWAPVDQTVWESGRQVGSIPFSVF